MLTDIIYLKKIPGLTDHSPLMDASKWKENNSAFKVIKAKPYDIENIELEIGVLKNIEDYDYAYIQPSVYPYPDGSVIPRVYKIKAVRQGPTTRNIGTSSFPSIPAGTCILSLELDALATWYVNRQGSAEIYGIWERTPSMKVVEPFQIRPAQMMRTTSMDVPSNLPTSAYARGLGVVDLELHDLIYVQINFVSGSTLYSRFYIASMEKSNYGLYALTGSGGRTLFPSLNDLLVNSGTGITASEIISINVSNRCPYHVGCGTTPQHSDPGLYLTYVASGVTQYVEAQIYTPSPGTSYAYYEVARGTSLRNRPIIDLMYNETLEMTITLAETCLGYFSVRDGGKNVVGTIDTRYTDPIPDITNRKLSITVQTVSDGVSLYTELILKDDTIIRYPEGNVPFAGDAYKEYSIAQMAYDREMLAINQERVKTNAITGIVASLTNGAIASIGNGGLGAATAGIGAIGTAIETASSLRLSEREQEARERLMHDTPDNAYQTGYGYSYIINILRKRGASIELIYPEGVTASEVTSYLQNHGYPVDGYYGSVSSAEIATAEIGYIRCRKLTTALVNGNAGVWFRALDKQLRNGAAFRVYT